MIKLKKMKDASIVIVEFPDGRIQEIEIINPSHDEKRYKITMREFYNGKLIQNELK
jgi:hypothetical protein